MNYRVDMNADSSETAFHDFTVQATYFDLVRAFGEPALGDGEKISSEWAFVADDGNVFTLYDWKSTNLYAPQDNARPSVRTFQKRMHDWHIGSKDLPKGKIAEFQHWAIAQIRRATPREDIAVNSQ